MRVFFLIISIVILSNSGFSQQLSKKTIIHETERSYYVYLPSTYIPQKQNALIIALHGIGNTAEKFMKTTELNEYGEQHDYIIVHPQAINSKDGIKNVWNAKQSLFPTTTDDIGFLNTLIDELISTYNINPKDVFMTGFSNGSMLTYRFICEQGDKINAIVCVGATPHKTVIDNCTTQIPIVHIHGTKDSVAKYKGWGFPISMPSVIKTLSKLKENNDCIDSKTIELEDPNLKNDISVEKITYKNCNNIIKLEHYKYNNMKHKWPGKGDDYKASDIVIDFFNSYRTQINNDIPNTTSKPILYNETISEVLDITKMNIDIEYQEISIKNYCNDQIIVQIKDVVKKPIINVSFLDKGIHTLILKGVKNTQEIHFFKN